MEEIAFSEWSERLDIVGSNHWLPAYGYKQPTQLQQALLQQHDRDAELLSNDGGAILLASQQQQQFLFLETIVEETSDDLRSESDRSGPVGWPDSDSDTESVIHVGHSLGSCERPEWSGSERDLAVPKKRRRRAVNEAEDAEGGEDGENTSLSSRSSSLIQFECLERHCEDVFRTSATADPFHDPTSPSPSAFSFDSLESNRWRFSASPDSLDEEGSVSSGEEASSDDTLQHSSWSSFRSSNGSRMRSYRSFDSLNLLQQQQQQHTLAELSQSLGNNSLLSDKKLSADHRAVGKVKSADSEATIVNEDIDNNSGKENGGSSKPQRSAENLSEDSGFGDNTRARSVVLPVVEDEDSCSSYYSDCSAANSESSSSSSASSSRVVQQRKSSVAKRGLKIGGELEFSEKRGWAAQDSNFNSSCWQSAPSLLPGVQEGGAASAVYCGPRNSQDHLCSVPDNLNLCSRDDEEPISLEDKSIISMARRLPVVSTPNLHSSSNTPGEGNKEFLRREQEFCSTTSTISVPLNDDMDMYLEDKIILSKSLTPLPGSQKGVHFCPVVSEVSWRDSFSEDETDEEEDEDEIMDQEMIKELQVDESKYKVEEPEDDFYDDRDEEEVQNNNNKVSEVVGNQQGQPEQQKPGIIIQKLQIGVPISPSERERVVMDVVPPTLAGSHVVSTPATPPSVSVPMATQQKQHLQPRAGSESNSESSSDTSSKKSGSRLGGFFQRFSLRRLSGRHEEKKKAKEEKKNKGAAPVVNQKTVVEAQYEDVTIIPLHPPPEEQRPQVARKPPLPPLPPRIVASSAKAPTPVRRGAPASAPGNAATGSVGVQQGGGGSSSPAMSASVRAGASAPSITTTTTRTNVAAPIDQRRDVLLETDLDTAITTIGTAPPHPRNNGKKARSLLNLGEMSKHHPHHPGGQLLEPPRQGGAAPASTEARAKSMEFLLDKENQAAIQPPENELQKVGAGERVMSEHQLRVQRSLQKLNVPDWYKNSNVARGPEGFLLKRHSDASQHGHQGWPGLSSKTTSLSSLGSSQSAAARSPTSHLLSPSPTPHVFTRWSTSRLNSSATSASTSPCGSTRSSFNYRQPYLGWRSQERLSRPRTPAERLAAGLLPVSPSSPQPPESEVHKPAEEDDDIQEPPQVPNLSEVRTSIKEVTSAIVHYVSGVRDGSGEALAPTADGWDRDSLSPWGGERRTSNSSPRSSSPRGSGRLCWLESSFVGSRPLDSPETPNTLTSTDVTKTLNSTGVARMNMGGELYLDLNKPQSQSQNFNNHQVNGDAEPHLQHHKLRTRPSPGSTTLEDVLDSLLGLPPASRSPSPGPGSVSSPNRAQMPPPPPPPPPLPPRSHTRRSCGDLRPDLAGSVSDGEKPILVEPPPYYVADTLRRRSEGSDPGPRGRNRRVSFDVAAAAGMTQQQQQQQLQHQQPMDSGGNETVVRCRYSKCGRVASMVEARRTFKTCHNCEHVYCSRECRRAHWERHRKTCLHSRVGALCRQVLSAAKEDPETLRHLSMLARRGYLAQGRGAVKSFFSSPELAERFVARGFMDLGEPAYVRWADLLPGEMGAELYSELLRLCKSYNPDSRFVLYVAVCVVSEVPTSGAVKWERQLVSRCAKLRLCRSLTALPVQPPPPPVPQRRSSPCNITRDMENPETLILTSLPGCHGQMPPHRAREISFTNIQRHLRQRGVSLRRHFPDVYKRLCAYVEGSTERFTPVTIYPRDAVTGKCFMCIIMPDAEPEKLELVPRDSSRVQTIDISLEHEDT
ncbi:uncharacterized protein [Anabrus simplex]|uniref:uncharacterized protein n=1 Tax=Anabrus simplex TaxID=316456 RepID=UPI0035A38FF9